MKNCAEIGKNRGIFAVFWESEKPLTPSFVGSNPATPARYPVYCGFFAEISQYAGLFFAHLGTNRGLHGVVKDYI